MGTLRQQAQISVLEELVGYLVCKRLGTRNEKELQRYGKINSYKKQVWNRPIT
jgi:hypothetical protein